MIRWIPYTFVRTVLFFIGGILLGLYSPDLISESVSFVLLGGMAVLYFAMVLGGRCLQSSLNPGWVGLCLVFVAGFIHVVLQTESRDPDHLINNKSKITHYQAIITRFAEEKARSWKMEARVTDVHTDRWEHREGKLILYLPKDGHISPFRYGDVLLIKGQPDIPEGPANPGQFDYRGFLTLKNIYHQHFLRAGEAVKISHVPPNRFIAFAFRWRESAEAILKRFIHGAREQAIASALVLGVTEGLDNDQLNAYAATGSMHILAVSGLHVSVLCMILLWVLKPLNRIPAGRWLIAFIALAVLWLYAFVTGLSPSVLRAVGMFSFFAIARPWARSTNIYNTLAVSAFCLLLFDPFLIRSVGFQLSYLAVLGIVYLYPRILVFWEPQHSITTKIWKLSAVSVAAQIATFPLGLLYFHQFPNYFLLSNILVVPLASVVLVAGLLVLGLSLTPSIASVLGYGLEMTIRFLNGMVFTLEDLPFSVTENVYISPWQCCLIFLFIMVVLALAQYRRFNFVVIGFLIAVAYAGLQWWHFFKEVNVHKVTVYKVPGHTAIDVMDRGQVFFIADSIMRGDEESLRYNVTPNRLLAGVGKANESFPLAKSLNGCKLMYWHGKHVLLINDRNFDLPDRFTVDWLIIANNAVEDLPALIRRITCEKVILDSSNSFFFATRFLEAAKFHNLDVHSVLHRGAFTLKLENKDT
jgi:competence protein ComEC